MPERPDLMKRVRACLRQQNGSVSTKTLAGLLNETVNTLCLLVEDEGYNLRHLGVTVWWQGGDQQGGYRWEYI